MTRKQLASKHSLFNNAIFLLKTYLLIIKRGVHNFLSNEKRFSKTFTLENEQVISFSKTSLWNPHDNSDNWILTAGKIENLRIASKNLNGIEVKANEVFSFWRHIGNPNFGKGYVVGREIREGCIIPTIGGGLCQISNALYDAALKANFDIIERHQHTKIVKGSLAEQNRDATVKWNYVDLKFKSRFDFRIEVEFTSEDFLVYFKSKHKNEQETVQMNAEVKKSDKLNDCYSCGNVSCHLHPKKIEKMEKNVNTTFILDEKWQEYDEYIASKVKPKDVFILPIKQYKFLNFKRYYWKSSVKNKVFYLNFWGFYRTIYFRVFKRKRNVFELSLELDKKLAEAAAKKIPINSQHLVVSQNLLPFLLQNGALGGRKFDVLMNRLPIEKLHERLNFANSIHTESKTLHDFRAPEQLIKMENNALNQARRIISPHVEIHEIFKNKVEKLSWHIPKNSFSRGNKILFPASSLARKGAYEMRRLTKELSLEMCILGSENESENFWKNMRVEKFNGNYNEIALVVYPVFVENQPRTLLKAMSYHIPIITTKASGLQESANVKILEIGAYDAFKEEILNFITSI